MNGTVPSRENDVAEASDAAAAARICSCSDLPEAEASDSSSAVAIRESGAAASGNTSGLATDDEGDADAGAATTGPPSSPLARAKPPGSAQPLSRPRPSVRPRTHTRTRRGIRPRASSGGQGAFRDCTSLKTERRLAVSELVGASGSGGTETPLQTVLCPVAARLRIASPSRAQRVRSAPNEPLARPGTGRAASLLLGNRPNRPVQVDDLALLLDVEHVT